MHTGWTEFPMNKSDFIHQCNLYRLMKWVCGYQLVSSMLLTKPSLQLLMNTVNPALGSGLVEGNPFPVSNTRVPSTSSKEKQMRLCITVTTSAIQVKCRILFPKENMFLQVITLVNHELPLVDAIWIGCWFEFGIRTLLKFGRWYTSMLFSNVSFPTFVKYMIISIIIIWWFPQSSFFQITSEYIREQTFVTNPRRGKQYLCYCIIAAICVININFRRYR